MATEYGKLHETFAIEAFEAEYNLKVEKCGLFIDKEHYFLGASPDGTVENEAIIEIKCPQCIKKLHPKDAIKEKKIKFAILEGDTFKLKRNHDYFYQIQGQLAI